MGQQEFHISSSLLASTEVETWGATAVEGAAAGSTAASSAFAVLASLTSTLVFASAFWQGLNQTASLHISTTVSCSVDDEQTHTVRSSCKSLSVSEHSPCRHLTWLQLQDLQTNARVSHWLAQASRDFASATITWITKKHISVDQQFGAYLIGHQKGV